MNRIINSENNIGFRLKDTEYYNKRLQDCTLVQNIGCLQPENENTSLKNEYWLNLNLNVSYHDGEYNSGHGGLEDPEQSQAEDLDEGEEVDLPEGDVSQVNQVRLMLRWHQKQLETIHKLHRWRHKYT